MTLLALTDLAQNKMRRMPSHQTTLSTPALVVPSQREDTQSPVTRRVSVVTMVVRELLVDQTRESCINIVTYDNDGVIVRHL